MDRVEQGGEMSVLCHGNCHVTLTHADACMCGAVASQPYPLSGGIFPGYNPYGPPKPNTPPTAGAAPPVNIRVFRAAQLIGSHLSADGSYVYTVRYGKVLQAEWKGSDFGAWLDIGEEMPAGAVAM